MIVGFDPGKTGAIVVVETYGGKLWGSMRMPLIGAGTRQRIDGRAVCAFLKDIPYTQLSPHTFAYERVHSMPTDSVVSAFTFGKATGQVIGLAEALGFSMVEIAPTDWQKVMLRHQPRGTSALRKKSAALVASDLFPGLAEDLRVKANWGIADAALLAEYMRRQLNR